MDKSQMETNLEKQVFEDLDVNPYEVVIAVSKMARQINYKAMKYLGPEADIKPISMALKKLENRDIRFTYENENNEEELNPPEEPVIDEHELQ